MSKTLKDYKGDYSIRGTCDIDDEHLHSKGRTCKNWQPEKKEPPHRPYLMWWFLVVIAWLVYLAGISK